MVRQPELLVSKNNNNYYKYRRTLNRAQTRNILLKALSNQSRDRSGGGGAICVGRSTGCSTTLFYSSLYTFSFSPTLRRASSRQEIFSEVLMMAMNTCLYWLLNIIIILLLFLSSSISQSKHWYWSSCHKLFSLSSQWLQTKSIFGRILAQPSSADFALQSQLDFQGGDTYYYGGIIIS